MKKMLKPASLATALLAMAPQVYAGEFFIGANVGTSNFSALNEECDELVSDNRVIGGFPVGCEITEDSDTTLGINAGYNFNSVFGVEVGYIDLGEYSANITTALIPVPATASADITYAGLVLTAPFTEKFSISARLGGVNANAEVSAIGASLEVEDETTGFVGASVDYRITEKISIQLRYDDLDVIDITSAGIRYHF